MNEHLLVIDDFLNALGYEFLRVLTLAERVHHVHNHERDLVRVLVRDANVLRSRLGRRIRVRRLVSVPFVEHRRSKRGTEHFVRGEVKESLQVTPVSNQSSGVFKQRDRGLDVVTDERHGIGDGVINVRLRRHVDDEFDVVPELVRDPLRNGLDQVCREHLDAVEHTGVTQSVVAKRRVRQLVDYD